MNLITLLKVQAKYDHNNSSSTWGRFLHRDNLSPGNHLTASICTRLNSVISLHETPFLPFRSRLSQRFDGSYVTFPTCFSAIFDTFPTFCNGHYFNRGCKTKKVRHCRTNSLQIQSQLRPFSQQDSFGMCPKVRIDDQDICKRYKPEL